MKGCLIILTAICSGWLFSNLWLPTGLTAEIPESITASATKESESLLPEKSINLATNRNICALFADNSNLEEISSAAPPPVRTLERSFANKIAITREETQFYEQLGLVPNEDGSYVCLAKDPAHSNRQFTIFQVKKFNQILVVSTFLDSGKFLPGQKQASTNLFLETIRFYTNIPQDYYGGIKRYFQEFYLRIEDGRLQPTSDRAYPVDEPEATVIIYHPLRGKLQGTGISLNISLD
jgi:hypothetical protein